MTWRTTRARMREDRRRIAEHFSSLPGPTPVLWLHPALQCVWLHRISFFLHANGHRLLARAVWHLNLLLTACDIGPTSDIGGGLVVCFPLAVTIFGRVGRNCTIRGHAAIGGGTERMDDIGAGPGLPVIGDDVTLGWGTLVLGPIRVGDRVVVGHGALISGDVPDDSLIPDVKPLMRRARVS